jgi:hypothetical protein
VNLGPETSRLVVGADLSGWRKKTPYSDACSSVPKICALPSGRYAIDSLDIGDVSHYSLTGL